MNLFENKFGEPNSIHTQLGHSILSMLPYQFQRPQNTPDMSTPSIRRMELPSAAVPQFYTSSALPSYAPSFSSQRALPLHPSSSMIGLFPPATSYCVPSHNVSGMTSQNLRTISHPSHYRVHTEEPRAHVVPSIATTSKALPITEVRVLSVNNRPNVTTYNEGVIRDQRVGRVVDIQNEDVSPGRTSRPVSVSPKLNKPLLSPAKKRAVVTSPTRRKHNHRIKGERVGERVAQIENIRTKH